MYGFDLNFYNKPVLIRFDEYFKVVYDLKETMSIDLFKEKTKHFHKQKFQAHFFLLRWPCRKHYHCFSQTFLPFP